jgi:hypothetical protein
MKPNYISKITLARAFLTSPPSSAKLTNLFAFPVHSVAYATGEQELLPDADRKPRKVSPSFADSVLRVEKKESVSHTLYLTKCFRPVDRNKQIQKE